MFLIDSLIVVCEQKIYVFNFINLQNLDTIDTCENPKGILAVSGDPKTTVIAFPDKTKGYIRVKSYGKFDNISNLNMQICNNFIFEKIEDLKKIR